MTDPITIPGLTPALEDYLETIFRLIGKGGEARVGDIAKERDVRPGSVTPAMKRLDHLGLIHYPQRDNIGLTKKGEEIARRVFARHQILTRFFTRILNVPPELAEADACAAEHSLSVETVDQLVRLFEYMEVCPEGRDHVQRFLSCSAVHDNVPPCTHDCAVLPTINQKKVQRMCIADLKPGQSGRVQQVDCHGAVRQRLLDMGILPGTRIEVARMAPAGDPVWIKLEGYELALRISEAKAVSVELQ